MRITGGIFGRLQIKVPSGDLRPTQDMVRAALFSMLGERTVGSRFLDLFAGSGAVGLEAASRGASAVSWVESDRSALSIIRANVERVCGEGGCRAGGVDLRVCGGDVFIFLEKGLESRRFDLIFADPPYDREGEKGWLARLLAAIDGGDVLAPGGLFIMEQSAGETVAENPAWLVVKDRKYGSTRLLFFARKDKGGAQDG